MLLFSKDSKSYLFIIAALFLSSISFYSINSSLGFWFKILQIIAFFGAGFLHSLLLNKSLSSTDKKNISVKLFFSIQLTVIILAALVFLYLFINKILLSIAFASASAFLLPSIITQCFIFFTTIPSKKFKLWYPKNIKEDKATVIVNSIPLYFKLTKRYFDIEEISFFVTADGNKTLSSVFNEFIIEQNQNGIKNIECYDKKHNFYAWEFFIKTNELFGMKRLNPELNLRINKIKNDSIIIAKRIKVTLMKEIYSIAYNN
ncbi:MAG: TssN family type VI secretion system protein [Chitinophagaceae bacterium]